MNAQHKNLKTFAVLVYGYVYIIGMVILRSQNKITDVLMILAWACPFKAENLLFLTDYTTFNSKIFIEKMSCGAFMRRGGRVLSG